MYFCSVHEISWDNFQEKTSGLLGEKYFFAEEGFVLLPTRDIDGGKINFIISELEGCISSWQEKCNEKV